MADEDLVRGDAPLFPPDVPAHDTLAAARIAGYGWDEINAHVGERTNMALGAGYTQGEVDRHLGWPDPSFFDDYTKRGWEQRLSNKPELAGALLQQDPAPMLSGSWIRQDYADALVAGHAKDPLDFSRKYVGAYLKATGEVEGPATQERAAEASAQLAQTLPSHNEAVDYALAMTAAAGFPITPGQIGLTKANLMDHWAATGSGPEKTYTEALGNADLRERMTTPQRLVSTILEGTLTAAQFFKGAGEGAAAGFTGDESLRDRAKDMSKAEAGGAALGLLPGLLLSPVYAGAKGLDQAVNEGIVDYDAAAKGAGAVMFLKPGWTPSTPVRVFDPLKAPGEAVREAPLSQALARDDALHEAAQSVVGLSEAAKIENLSNKFSLTADAKYQGQWKRYSVEKDGEANGYVYADIAGDTASIKQIQMYGSERPGPAAMRQLARQFFEQNPEVTSIDGLRVSGARPSSATASVTREQVLGQGEHDPKAAAELSKGYDAAAALTARMNPEFYSGFSLSAARDGLMRLWRSPAQMADAAAQAEAKTFAEATIRKFRGMSDRDIAQHFNAIEQYRADINQHMGEYARWLRMGPMRPTQKPLIADMIDYMEGRSVGATLDPNSNFMGVANALRNINERMRQEIEVHAPEFDSFYQDYYRHLWVNTRDADAAFGVGRQGSGRSLNERTIPTISEGIDRGLMPKILDPIENTLHYAAGMSSYLAARRVLQASRDAGYVTYGVEKPEPGWMRLEGMKSTLPAGDNGIQFAWAPPGFAKSYNNWVDQGFHRWEIGGKIYDSLQRAANVMTGFKLALSGYHGVNIIKETATAELTNGIGEISRGDLTNGLRDMGFGATILPGTVDYLKKGAAYQKKFLDPLSTDPVVDLLTQAGFNPLSRSHRYGGVSSPDISNINRGPTIYQMLSRHTFKWQMAEEAKAVMGTAEEAAGYRAVMTGPRAVGFLANQVGRVLNAFNSPVFDQLVPKVKAAAASDEMEAWLRGNPTAGREEQLSVARKLVDSMDDRFGEMNQDNLFWNKMIKQTLNLFTVSMGWEYGTLRAFGGGAKDVLSGDLGSTRARWMMAYPAMIALTSAMYQYLHTGEAPQGPMDLVLPRTGGKTPDGLAPERALGPGYEKDMLQMFKAFFSAPNFMGMVGNVASMPLNKLNPFWAAIRTTVSGQDSVGHNIASEPNPPFQSWGLPPDIGNFLRYLGKEVTPIPIESLMERPKHTGISDAERLLGYRAPSIFFENRELFDQRQKARDFQLKKQEFRRDLREKAKIE